jgi:glycosyltransferase involved in cell wall biosynthesis
LSNGHAELTAPLRIAHLTATFPPYPGGAGNTAYRFAKGQAERGHHVEVFTAPADGDPPDPGGALVHRVRPVLAIGNAPLIPSVAAIDGFDVIHLHYPFIFGSELTLLGRLARRRRQQALLVHYKNRLVAKGARQVPFEGYEHTVAPLLMRAADRICVLSPDHAASVSYLRGIAERDPSKLIEMPNGVDARLFAPGPDEAGVRAAEGIPEDAVVAAFVATLDRAHHFKRLDVALRAIAQLDEGVHLLVAGGGELLDDFRRQASQLGVDDRVHFLGRVPHSRLPTVLRAADFMLLTTEPPESFGIVLIEAMACGLPTASTEYPGVRAVVDEGETGLLVPPGDPGAAAAAINRIVEAGPSGRAAMGAAGRDKAERLWSWPRLLDRMDAAYSEAIEARRRRLD